MKRTLSLVILISLYTLVMAHAPYSLDGCCGDGQVIMENNEKLDPILQNLINNMVYVEGGTFMMGSTPEQGNDDSLFPEMKPIHEVTLSSYYIGKYEVTQEEWVAVMEYNPSSFQGARKPVENISWRDCQKFINKLNKVTGLKFRLPTEAEWEFAARGGNHSNSTRFSGDNDIKTVAWCGGNSGRKTHNVGTLVPNELGIHDMSGNVNEWCQDWYGKYSSVSQTNPQGPSSGSHRIHRGGNYLVLLDDGFSTSFRTDDSPGYHNETIGFRLAISQIDSDEDVSTQSSNKLEEQVRKADLNNILKNLISNMVYVQGGTFIMGTVKASSEVVGINTAHKVTLSSFNIGKFEVTQEEWEAVMDNNPSEHVGAKKPVENVSWHDCQAFINKLNELTGRNFRLPTEAEWEFAAHGGKYRYKYAGGNVLNSVAWYEWNSGSCTHDVGTKSPNGLGLYDMSGNVSEWCKDWYSYYTSSDQIDPEGPSFEVSFRVARGGSWCDDSEGCGVSNRGFESPSYRRSNLGFRLAY